MRVVEHIAHSYWARVLEDFGLNIVPALTAEVAIAQGGSGEPLGASLTALLENRRSESVAVARFEPKR